MVFDQNNKCADSNKPKVFIYSGKGDVGKTMVRAPLAIAMLSARHTVAVVSTDLMHSLGDALGVNLQGGFWVNVQLITGGGGDGLLKALEIDHTLTLKDFCDSIDGLLGKCSNNQGNMELSSALDTMGEIDDMLLDRTDKVVRPGHRAHRSHAVHALDALVPGQPH